MSSLQGLNQSVSQMNHDKALGLIMDMRKRRRTSKSFIETDRKRKRIDLSGVDEEQAQRALNKIRRKLDE